MADYAKAFFQEKLRVHAIFAKSKDRTEELWVLRSTASSRGLTARQHDAARVSVEGAYKSAETSRFSHIEGLKVKIVAQEKKVSKLEKDRLKPVLFVAAGLAQVKKDIHQANRHLQVLQSKLKKADKPVSLCFGSRKRFKAQYHLKENELANHKEWKDGWELYRVDEVFLVGDKNQIAGNQGCTLIKTPTGYTGRLRVPDSKYVHFQMPDFAYGNDHIKHALSVCNTHRQKTPEDEDSDYRGPVTIRLKLDEKGWEIFVTIHIPIPKIQSRRYLGAFGIDLNVNHLAWAEIDRFGNKVRTGSIPLVTYGASPGQAESLTGEAIKELLQIVKSTEKPIVIETLDFSKKKQTLREKSNRYARMLSSFAYSRFAANLEARCLDFGIDLCRVNPAYTSLIGDAKYSVLYGITVHQAAALTIARRLSSYREGIPEVVVFHSTNGDQVTFPRPADRGKHVWSSWAALSRSKKQALVARWQASSTNKSGSLVGISPPNVLQKSRTCESRGIDLSRDTRVLPNPGCDSWTELTRTVGSTGQAGGCS